ncbi:MAG: FKBP-type peptidyl-prolyl cis-trans isomerase [Lachnospiraceae bacterium]|nr:FKBP-type peptidyl-prolyl cis-trans isomerase [Lachnospiraceae bacterium]
MKKWMVVLGLSLSMLLAACGKKDDGDKTATGQTSTQAGKVTKLGDYKNFTYDEYSFNVTDEEIRDYYEETVQLYIDYGVKVYEEDASRAGTAVQDGDTINIDYTGYVNDEAFENGSDKGYDLTIGSGSFIDGFESSLIGKTVGDTVDINVTFPDPYQNNPDLAGVDAVFTVTINYVGNEVPITNDNAYDVLFGYDDIEVMYSEIKELLEDEYVEAEDTYYEDKKSEYIESVVTSCEFEGLEEEIEWMYNTEVGIMLNAASANGISADVLVTQYYGYESIDAYREETRQITENNIKMNYVANEIAELENITMSDEKFEEIVLPEIEAHGLTDVAEYEAGYDAQYGTGEFRQLIFTSYVFDTLFEKYATMTPIQ